MNSKRFFTLLLLTVSTSASAVGGSLINADEYRAIVADQRAYRVGDPLTVVVVESAMAASSAATGTEKDWRFGANIDTGEETRDFGAGAMGEADGNGKTVREGRLQAQIAVRVVAIENDDLLRIHGEQTIVINGEQQTIAIEGLVRREDIGPDNAVLSPRLADVMISFTGDGVVADSQERSWIYRMFEWLGLI